ncbi:glycoside hydrolase family 31 protein [Actinomycetaceae bacterium TAE3-ERU4]|nr:glycoside hydrolase family 31 protein [Actinomycetaceae bacterium TAE3-ERU4]
MNVEVGRDDKKGAGTPLEYCQRALKNELQIKLLPGEHWWGGLVTDGAQMPFDENTEYSRDLGHPEKDAMGLGLPSNQVSPSLVSNRGRLVFSKFPFKFTFQRGVLLVQGKEVEFGQCGQDLRGAYSALSRIFFGPSGKMPASQLFTSPQYNTWIEMPYLPTQEKTLAYAKKLLEGGMKPGVLMIDDNWASTYGTWEFDRSRFPDPVQMITELHELGFSVMLWVVPFISPDTATFRELEKRGYLLRQSDGEIALRRWWNGISATFDLSNPEAEKWIHERLRYLIEVFGVDGFKFDAGDIRDYREDDETSAGWTPVEFCEKWAQIASCYPFNEIRACWKNSGLPIAQRLEDKPPAWGAKGIGTLIPNLLAQGMIGHPYSCPDMVGGGEISAMQAQSRIDEEFFVRYCQVAALSPMIQFSTSPCRVLTGKALEAVKKALDIRERFLPLIMRLATESACSAEPIMRPISYHVPGAPKIIDQFFLGENLLVAPVIKRGQKVREVILPAGRWVGDDGIEYLIEDEYASVEIEVPLGRLPYFQNRDLKNVF